MISGSRVRCEELDMFVLTDIGNLRMIDVMTTLFMEICEVI
jgi:hypothetical protein